MTITEAALAAVDDELAGIYHQRMVDSLWATLTDPVGAGSDLTLSRSALISPAAERASGHLGVVGEGSIDVNHLADVAVRTALLMMGPSPQTRAYIIATAAAKESIRGQAATASTAMAAAEHALAAIGITRGGREHEAGMQAARERWVLGSSDHLQVDLTVHAAVVAALHSRG